MIINHNCCIKLVPLVILLYDARSHIHQILYLTMPSVAKISSVAFSYSLSLFTR